MGPANSLRLAQTPDARSRPFGTLRPRTGQVDSFHAQFAIEAEKGLEGEARTIQTCTPLPGGTACSEIGLTRRAEAILYAISRV